MADLCETLVTAYPFIEAAFLLSADTDYTWYGKKSENAEELLRTINSVISTADELNLFNSVPGASVTLSTEYGALYIYSVDIEHILVLCLLDGYSLQAISELLSNTVNTVPS